MAFAREARIRALARALLARSGKKKMRPSAKHMSASEVTPQQTLIPNRSLILKSWKTPLQEAWRQWIAARFS